MTALSRGVEAVNENQSFQNASLIFLLGLSWPLSVGIRGLIGAWGFYSGVSIQTVATFTGIIGLLCLVFCWRTIFDITHTIRSIPKGNKIKGVERIILTVIALLVLFYLYRIGLPWSDHDEMNLYGYTTKMIAHGWSYLDIERLHTGYSHSGSSLVLCADAPLFGLTNDTYLVRLFRLVNLLVSSISIYSFLTLFNVKRIWKLFSVAYFLCHPELSILGLSLKNDAVVMMFETHSFMLLILTALVYFDERKRKSITIQPFSLCSVAVIMSLFSFASRVSGLYPVILSYVITILLFSRSIRHKFSTPLCLTLLGLFGMGILASVGYLANIRIIGNPFYAYDAPMMANFREIFNVHGLPPLIKQVYLLLYMGAGIPLIDRYFPLPSFIPIAQAKMTGVWTHNPILFVFFLWPFFVKFKRVLAVIGGIFLYQFTLWSIGIHHSRTFFGTTTLIILMTAFIMDMDLKGASTTLKKIQQMLKVWLVISLATCFIIQFYWSLKHYHDFGIFYSTKKRYEAKNKWLKLNPGFQIVDEFPSFEEFNQMDKIISRTPQAKIVAISSIGNIFHMYFHKPTLSVYRKSLPYADYVFIEKDFLLRDKDLERTVKNEFPINLYETKNGKWILVGK